MTDRRKYRFYSEQTKAEVMAALLAGQSISQVAAQYKLPKGTVSTWRKALKAGRYGNTTQKADSPPLDELLLGYVSENLVTLREQAKFLRDPDWLRKQPASELAVLHGVLTDKSIRLLEIFGSSQEQSEVS